MSASKYALYDAAGTVVNCIVGSGFTPSQEQAFIAAHPGAVGIVGVDDGVSVWIGGTYTDGVFAPPPAPEPAPEIIEGTSEVLPEPQPEPEP